MLFPEKEHGKIEVISSHWQPDVVWRKASPKPKVLYLMCGSIRNKTGMA